MMEPHKKTPGILATQIAQVEHNIHVRRHAIKESAVLLKKNARERLTSPKALITYAGMGLAIGLLVVRRTPRASEKAISKTPLPAQTAMDKIERFLAKIFKIVAMGRTLATLFPEVPPRAPSRGAHNLH